VVEDGDENEPYGDGKNGGNGVGWR